MRYHDRTAPAEERISIDARRRQALTTPVATRAARPQRDLTTGSPGRHVLRLALPSAAETALTQVVTLIDIIWLGRLGGVALSAATLGYTLRLVLISPMMGLSVGGMALVARHLGARNRAGADHAVMQSLLLLVAFVLSLSIVGWLLAPTLLRWMGAEGALLSESVAYCRVVFAGLLFMEMLPTMNGVIRGAGHPEYTLRSNLVNVAVMAIAEPVLVLGLGPVPALGVAGAAWAVVLGSVAGVLVQLVILVRGSAGVAIHLSDARPDLGTMRRILRIAMPTALQRLSPNLANAVLLRIIAGLGTDVLGAYSVVSRLFGFLQCLSVGIGNAAATMMGQNLGAGKPERAERATTISMWSALGASLAAYGLLNLAAAPILGLLLEEPAVIAIAAQALLFTVLSGSGFGWLQVVGYALSGAGDAVSPMAVNMAALWLVQLPAAWALSGPLGLGAIGVWIGIALGYLAGATVITLQFRRGTWKTLTV
jgi:putative MATE family efflux protein